MELTKKFKRKTKTCSKPSILETSMEEQLKINPSLFDLWYAQALNGQYKRLEFFLILLSMTKSKLIIETGTYLGSSTIFFANFINKVYTIESNQNFFMVSQKRFKKLNLPNIEGVLGRSEMQLSSILKGLPSNSNEILLAYLDAHWDKEIPTTLELNELSTWGGPFIAMVDDFRVEDDYGYGFDQYEDIIVSKTLIPKTKNLFLYFPNIKSDDECGARRGLGIILNEKAKEIINPRFFEICRQHEI
jgi:predicted O-methyltransferase YrrM